MVRVLPALDYLVSAIPELPGWTTTNAIMFITTPSAQWAVGLASTGTSTSAKVL